jgi:hypothetical protein
MPGPDAHRLAANDVTLILVTLFEGGEQSLFILLDAEGLVNRMGNGSVDDIEREMFIGKADLDLFQQLHAKLTPEVLQWFGQQLEAPQMRGKICELTVTLKQADGRELMTAWRYGSQSQGPPPEVRDFVVAAIDATDPWFEQQKARVRGPPLP